MTMGMSNQRQVYGETLVELGRKNKRIVVLDADLGKSTMGCLFKAAYPNRYFDMGIAEQNMTSFAAGLSLTGKVPFINSFAVFASGRAYDQIRQSICIGKLNVKIVGSSCGFSDFGDGATHQSIEDIAIMRAIPNMTVVAPCDGIETKKLVKAVAEYEGPVYIRLSRNDMPDIFPTEREFIFGEPSVIKEGRDITIFAHGVMVNTALNAAKTLEAEGISIKIVNVSTLKPIKDEKIIMHCSGIKGVVTAEEHSIIGGLGDIVTTALRGSSIPVELIGVNDSFGQSAESYDDLLKHYCITEINLIQAVKKLLKR